MHNRMFGLKNYHCYNLLSQKEMFKLFTNKFVEIISPQNQNHVKELSLIQTQKMQEMHLTYRHLLKKNFNNQIVYTLTNQSPVTLLAVGGFKKNNQTLWLSNTGSGHNAGSICFSLLPEIPAIFNRNDYSTKSYIYAVLLKNEYFLPGSIWREIISPGAFPIASEDFFLARELLGIDKQGQLSLGPLMGRCGKESYYYGENFDKFCQNKLVLPKEINQGDDYPLNFEIVDTVYTGNFQKEVTDYYKLNLFKYNQAKN